MDNDICHSYCKKGKIACQPCNLFSGKLAQASWILWQAEQAETQQMTKSCIFREGERHLPSSWAKQLVFPQSSLPEILPPNWHSILHGTNWLKKVLLWVHHYIKHGKISFWYQDLRLLTYIKYKWKINI